jgi:hypothetical protein
MTIAHWRFTRLSARGQSSLPSVVSVTSVAIEKAIGY